MSEFMIPSFMLYALLAGIGVALVAGPLGSFVVWRRMAYFGDTLSHAALLGVALALWFDIETSYAVLLVCVLLALLLLELTNRLTLSSDTILGILAHTSLSAGLIAVSLMDNVRVDLMAYLFGDLLAVNVQDLLLIYLAAIMVLVPLILFWSPILATIIHRELAKIEGVPVVAIDRMLVVMLAIVIAISMKVIGVLLISALLIIPAATARSFARSPEAMAILAVIFGMTAVALGLSFSWFYDTPAGPSVVASSAGLFALSRIIRR